MNKKKRNLIILSIFVVLIIAFTVFAQKQGLTLENVYKYKVRDKLNDIDTVMTFDKLITNSKDQSFSEIINDVRKKDVQISFYMAGHAYGNHHVVPELRTYIHPPLRELLPKIAKSNTIDFGVFLGDVVYTPNEDNIQNFKDDITSSGKPYYIAPGNHDLGRANDFFVDTNEYFVMNNNLFFVLTPRYNWVLDNNQIDLIKTQLKENADVDNIFVFTHYLFWLERNDTHFTDIEPNGFTEKDAESNFWEEVLPLFDNYDTDVYFIAGDVGAFANKPAYFYQQIDNYYFIATGMGGGLNDNILIAEIDNNNEVDFELIAINTADFYSLGDLEK